MNVSIFGLGYVGTVCAACFVELGHRVIGVDKSQVKVDLINSGKSPVIEPHLEDSVRAASVSGRLTATTDIVDAVASTDISIICVGTPSGVDGDLDLAAVEQVAGEIGAALRDKPALHTIVVRSTVLPGTTQNVIVPKIAEASGKVLGEGFEVAFNPEFLREGCAIADFNSPSKTVVGAFNAETAARVMTLYERLPGAKLCPPVETAELVKYIDNTWHALKVTFANEVGVIAKQLQIDSQEVMDIFLQDTRLNVSAAYLRPGFAFGGSCLKKDLRALTHMTTQQGLSIPLIESVLSSNSMIMERGFDWISSYPGARIAFLGISFKAGTDDVRESPYVALAQRLLDQGKQIRIFDPNVRLSQLVGANKEYLLRAPGLADLLSDDPGEVIEWAEIIVVTSNDARFPAVLASTRKEQTVLDLTGAGLPPGIQAAQHGFLW